MKYAIATGAVLALALSVTARATVTKGPMRTIDAKVTKAQQARVERGRYLVTSIGCGDCHTPKKMTPNGPEPDTTKLLSGHPEGAKLPPPPEPKGPWIASISGDMTAWAGPWGVSYTANLTPDRNTGLGIWTEQMFIDAIRKGKHMGISRPILPPMPWQDFRTLTDEDLKAIYAYLRSIPPVSNHVPDPLPPPELHK
jgi:mono/diheme cytochrome c family protein